MRRIQQESINLTQIKRERRSKIRLLFEAFILKQSEGILFKNKQGSVFRKGVAR